MSINGIGATNSSMMYAYMSQMNKTNASNASDESSSMSVSGMGQGMPPPPPPSFASNENDMMANEMGVRMRIQGQESGEDNGFTADQLSEMASEDSPMSELFSALADNFDEADADGDGVIKREEAMAYAEDNGIDVPPPPGPPPAMAGTDSGFTADQLSEMASEDSNMSELFSALADNFDAADTNGDGVITQDEAMAYAQDNDIDMPKPDQSISLTA